MREHGGAKGLVREGPPPRLTRRIGRDGRLIPQGDDPVPDGEWDIDLEFEEVRGRLYPTRLVLQPGIFHDGLPIGGITARLLHSIKLGELMDEFRREYQGNLAAEALFLGRHIKPTYRLPPPANRPGPRGYGEEFYQDVAVGYIKAAQSDPRRPIAAMASSFPGSSSANRRDWVDKAREKGYLPTPGQGRPGAEPTTKLIEALRARGVAPPKGTKSRPHVNRPRKSARRG